MLPKKVYINSRVETSHIEHIDKELVFTRVFDKHQ